MFELKTHLNHQVNLWWYWEDKEQRWNDTGCVAHLCCFNSRTSDAACTWNVICELGVGSGTLWSWSHDDRGKAWLGTGSPPQQRRNRFSLNQCSLSEWVTQGQREGSEKTWGNSKERRTSVHPAMASVFADGWTSQTVPWGSLDRTGHCCGPCADSKDCPQQHLQKKEIIQTQIHPRQLLLQRLA